MRIFGMIAALAIGVISAGAADEAKKPNVLIVFVDDLGWADVGFNGTPIYKTPHIDRIMGEAVNFTQAYSAHPVCSPTRAALISGKAPQRVGITQWISGDKVALPLEEVTIGEAFQEGGYRTGYIGKWHLGKKDEFQPEKQGFGWVKAVNRAGQPSSYFPPYAAKKPRPTDVPDLDPRAGGPFLTNALTDLANGFMQEKSEKPFFLILSQYAVHTPIEAPKGLVAIKQRDISEFYAEREREDIKERYGATTRGRQDHAGYAALVQNLDMNFGRLIEGLEKSGQLDNTIVVFTSDNGGLSTLTRGVGPTCNAPLRAGKGWCYEGGVRIPSFIYWKGELKPLEVDEPMITTDLYPTLLELCGLDAKPEQHLDGASLAGVMRGGESPGLDQRVIGWSYPHQHGSGHRPSNAIRHGDWKLIRFEEGKRYELYNLKDDLGETKDLAEQKVDKVRELDSILSGWLKETQKP